MDQPPIVESWGQGLVLMHNPNCLVPVPDGFFVDAMQQRLRDGRVLNDTNLWHPMSSRTLVAHLGPTKQKVVDSPFHEGRQILITAIPQAAFHAAVTPAVPAARMFYIEDGWFADTTRSFYGLVAFDTTDQDWGFIVFARNEYFKLLPHVVETSLSTRYTAAQAMRAAIIGLLQKPQRLFPELNP
jgi:hypothetical protein